MTNISTERLEEMRPCPFCGVSLVLTEQEEWVHPWDDVCPAEDIHIHHRDEPRINAWNRRSLDKGEAEPFCWWVSDGASEAYVTYERDEHARGARMKMLRGNWTETPLYAFPQPAPKGVEITEEMVECAVAAFEAEMGDDRPSRRVIHAALEAMKEA